MVKGLSLNIYFKIVGIFYCEKLVIRGYTGANKNNTVVDISIR